MENVIRPYVVCHMLTSLDGKIDGKFMSDPACAEVRTAYGQLRGEFHAQATMYGTVTMLGSYADGPAPALSPNADVLERKDYLAPTDVQNYIISVDPLGTLAFGSGFIEKKGRPRAHVIEVLTQQAPDAYLHYLRRKGVSYLFAGETALDCECMLKKLKSKFGIERMILAGGGYMNGSLLHRDLIDELSLVIAPLAEGNTGSVSIFEYADFLPERKPAVFELFETRVLDGSGLWLRYQIHKTNQQEE